MDDIFDGFAKKKEQAYFELTASGIPAFSGVRDLIKAAQAGGIGVAIASSGSPGKIEHNLKSSGLLGLVPQELVRLRWRAFMCM